MIFDVKGYIDCDYVSYGLSECILKETARSHLAYNIWHEINGYFFYAKPLGSAKYCTHVYIQHNLHPIFSLNGRSEIMEPYVSPIIRYCSRRLWPARHTADLPITLSTTWLPGSHIVAGWVDDIHNYYHLLFDLCPRILAILSQPEIPDNLPIVIIGPYNKLIQSVISALFCEIEDRFKFLHLPSVVVENVILPLTVQPSYMDVASIRKLSLRVKRQIENTQSNVIQNILLENYILYVFRGRGKNGRHISNEESFSRVLSEKLDARVIHPAALEPIEQWIEFSKARIIIAPHGAALSNLIAAKEETIIIELLPQSYQASTFNFVAAAIKLRYFRICYDDSHPEMPTEPIIDSLKRLLARENILISS